jgi:hypothetical protein
MSVDFFSKLNPDGSSLGQSAADKVAIFGGTPVVQPSGNAQAAITRGLACGSLCTFSATLTPGGVLTITTTGAGITPQTGTSASWVVAANDLVVLNKPSAQAGLGVGNVRVSAAGVVGLTFSNFSAATVTATAGEKYAMVAIRGFGVLTATLTPSPVLANTIVEQQFTVTGVRAGEVAIVSKPTTQAGLDIMGCRVVSNNLVGITFGNVTAATITPTAGEAYSVFSVGGMDATNNELLIQANLNPTALITNIGVTTINVVVSTIAASDTVTGVQKPTAQAGLACTGGFVSAAGAVGLVFCNPTAGALTPLLNEVYGIKVYRPNPVAPCTVISTTLSPSSVAANTTAEQTFTVTGIVAGTVVWVNSQAPQAGLGIVGCRVSGTNSVCITFGNSTAAAITPTASSTYVFADFNLPFDTAGVSVAQSASTVDQQQSLLTNAIRSALVALTGIAGA